MLSVSCRDEYHRKQNLPPLYLKDLKALICAHRSSRRRQQNTTSLGLKPSQELLPKLHGVVATEKIVRYVIDYCSGRRLSQCSQKQTSGEKCSLRCNLILSHGFGTRIRLSSRIQGKGHIMLIDLEVSAKLSR
ncbi:unnamed protein product [Cuscuta epithymum]|uniref:Uncharacterized protein n=1 Tax=Cuscuta epithymum TaxID=186058 RepID=A0AAV0CM55_9ASTE|nr:unnamed protein product [Cuscuta epithymum]